MKTQQEKQAILPENSIPREGEEMGRGLEKCDFTAREELTWEAHRENNP